jgi:hypothetical protein
MKPNLQNRFAQGRQAAITLCDFGGGTPPLFTGSRNSTPARHGLSCKGSDEIKRTKPKTTNPYAKKNIIR